MDTMECLVDEITEDELNNWLEVTCLECETKFDMGCNHECPNCGLDFLMA